MRLLHQILKSTSRERGFTSIELLITVTLLGVLLAIGLPSFQSLIASSRLTTATNDLLASLAQTRSEAVRLGNRVSICKSANGTQCVTTGDWEQGWIIFADSNRTTPDANNAFVNTGENISFLAQALPGGIVVKGNATVSQYVSFSADGQSKSLNGAFQAGTIRVCSTSGALSDDKRARDLVINSVGRIALEKPASVSPGCPAPAS
ncbi:MAG: hypothetical protein RL211_222 [Pseudomonadota bacterium]|jgi:type IV fimbrial biogenesis protein FimT